MTLEESNMGWFHIGEVWSLWIDGLLTKVQVDFICIDEAADDDGYIVDHYARNGSLIKSERLEAEDIRPEVESRAATDRPQHL